MFYIFTNILHLGGKIIKTVFSQKKIVIFFSREIYVAELAVAYLCKKIILFFYIFEFF